MYCIALMRRHRLKRTVYSNLLRTQLDFPSLQNFAFGVWKLLAASFQVSLQALTASDKDFPVNFPVKRIFSGSSLPTFLRYRVLFAVLPPPSLIVMNSQIPRYGVPYGIHAGGVCVRNRIFAQSRTNHLLSFCSSLFHLECK